MRKIGLLLFLFASSSVVNAGESVYANKISDTIPSFIKGNFSDDYGIRYTVSDTLWQQLPRARYYVIESNAAAQFIIARNGEGNATEPSMFTRIDYMKFSGMAPYEWGFCYTVYKAASAAEARDAAPADRQNPRKGCGGFPFSRMKKVIANY